MTEKEIRAFPYFTIPTVKKSKIYKQNFHFFAFYPVFTAVLRICVFAGNLPGDEKKPRGWVVIKVFEGISGGSID